MFRFTNADNSVIAPITPTAIALIGRILFSGELFFSYNLDGILEFSDITKVSQVSSRFTLHSGQSFMKLFTKTPSLVSLFARFWVVVRFLCCLNVSLSRSGLIVISF